MSEKIRSNKKINGMDNRHRVDSHLRTRERERETCAKVKGEVQSFGVGRVGQVI